MDSIESPKIKPSADIEGYFLSKYDETKLKKLKIIEETAISSQSIMDTECKLIFNIPTFYTEQRLEEALLTFLSQYESSPKFEISILINGPSGIRLEDSTPYKQAKQVQAKYPELKINIYCANYDTNENSRKAKEILLKNIREDLLALTLIRAGKSSDVDIENLLIATQDADLIQIVDDYVEEAVRHFKSKPETEGVAGLIDYPREDFDQDHLFFVVQLFEDILESKQQKPGKQISFRGGNSIFKVSHILKGQGFPNSFKVNNRAPYQDKANICTFNNGFQSNDDLWIVSSARRQMHAICSDIKATLGWRYEIEEDLSDIYLSGESSKLPDSAHKITSDDFQKMLERELHFMFLLHKVHNAIKDTTRDLFIETAEEIGIKIYFDENDSLKIQNIRALKERVLKDFSRF